MGGERRPQVQLKGPGICAYHKNGNGRLKKRLQKSRGPESQTGSDSTGAQFVVEFGYICHYSLVFSFGVPIWVIFPRTGKMNKICLIFFVFEASL